ncbi:hypothetical protein Hbl1158_00780 [Halobaculum sp. CBA1158]|uniref:hypothetical protein n=1 Tax=Halobaculum sp. CBA1158 TaxID=2904243 RepID=UPI001F3D0E64|nr:hypothetical protein [Halobaculum sp. CBA1158]UIO99942.1 hypothetical protein Hbl1158_00780 [Halobaculum sp. CBA1158]
MNRRQLLGVAGGLLPALAGCLDSGSAPSTTPDSPTPPSVEFELVDPELKIEAPPEVSVDDDTVTVRGTVQYGSSSCGTVKLAHAEYEDSQDRLDLLIVAADNSEDIEVCTDDLVVTGYRAEITVDGRLRRIAATEHHIFGETYSTTVDLTDY